MKQVSIPSQKSLDFIPRSVKSSSNLRRDKHSLSKKQMTIIPTAFQPSQQVKFKPINDWNSTKNIEKQQKNNILDSKYNVYKHGSPNYYSYNIQGLKANTLKNEIQTLDLPFIDNVIKQLKRKQTKQNNANMRDFQIYPNLLKTHQTHKFKELLSDKQELKDFLKLFETSSKLIEQKNIPSIKKFQEKQILISAGFSEITQQISKLSKVRSQILRMLWNKQNNQVQQIIQSLTSKTLQTQKQHLITLSKIHEDYQQQIDNLKKQNVNLSKNYNQQSFINKGYVNTLRSNRKTIKKYQILIKNLLDINENLVQDNLNLLDQNTKLILNNKLTINNFNSQQNLYKERTKNKIKTEFIPSKILQIDLDEQPAQLKYSQARILLYRRLQINSKKQEYKSTIRQIKKDVFGNIKKESQAEVIKKPFYSTLEELQQKKRSLYEYLKQRLEENPGEKLYLRDDFFHQDDHNIQNQAVEKTIKRIIDSKEVTLYLKNQCTSNQYQLKQIGVNTKPIEFTKPEKSKQQLASIKQNILGPQQIIGTNKNITSCANIFQFSLRKALSEDYQKNIRQSKLKTRNSLLNLELQRFKSVSFQKLQVQQLKEEQNQSDDQADSLLIANEPIADKKSLNKNIQSKDDNTQSKSSQFWIQLQQRIRFSLQQMTIKTKLPRKPQKYINPIFTTVWKNVINQIKSLKGKQPINLFKHIYEAIEKKSYQTTKSCESNVLHAVQIIKHYQSLNQLCLICSLLMGFSTKYKEYQLFIKNDIVKLYFELFSSMNIASGQSINIQKPVTNVIKLRSRQTQLILQKYFSKVKLIQINTKLCQLISYRKQNLKNIKASNQKDKKKVIKKYIGVNQTQTPMQELEQHFPLNQLLLYILEIYLIQKEKYFESYNRFLGFFIEQNGQKLTISIQKWKVLMFLFSIVDTPCAKNSMKENKTPIYCEDDFYRIAVLNDLPLLEQKLIQIQCVLSSISTQTVKQFQLNFCNQSSQKLNSLDKIVRWEQISQRIQKKYLQITSKTVSDYKNSSQQKKGIQQIINKMKYIVLQSKNEQKLQIFLKIYKVLIYRLTK